MKNSKQKNEYKTEHGSYTFTQVGPCWTVSCDDHHGRLQVNQVVDGHYGLTIVMFSHKYCERYWVGVLDRDTKVAHVYREIVE